MADDLKSKDTYSVGHDPITDLFTGGEGSKGERISTTELHEDGTSDTYKVDHDLITDFFTGGEGSKGERIATTKDKR